MNLIIKLLTFFKRNIHIFILLLTNNKSMNLYPNSILVKIFLYLKSIKIFQKLLFFKRYFTFWKHFRLIIKIVAYFNILLSFILIYMFTDFDQIGFINFIDLLGLSGFTSSLLAGLYLYHDSIIINFIKKIFNFEWLAKIRTEILKRLYGKSIPDSIPDSHKKINNSKVNIFNPADNINPPTEFNYKKYLLLGAGIIIIGYVGYCFWDWESITDGWNWSYNLFTTYIVRWGMYRAYLKLTDPFYRLYKNIKSFFSSPPAPPVHPTPGSIAPPNSPVQEEVLLNDRDIKLRDLRASFGIFDRRSGDIQDVTPEQRGLFKHPDSPNSDSSDDLFGSTNEPTNPDLGNQPTNPDLGKDASPNLSFSSTPNDLFAEDSSTSSTSSTNQPTSPTLSESSSTSDSSTPRASISNLPNLDNGVDRVLTDEEDAFNYWNINTIL